LIQGAFYIEVLNNVITTIYELYNELDWGFENYFSPVENEKNPCTLCRYFYVA
jgi:hypothetical protein